MTDLRGDVGIFMMPPVAGAGLKVGDHHFSMSGDPDVGREAGLDETRAVLDVSRSRLNDFDRYRLAYGRTCFYTVESDAAALTAWAAGARREDMR